jgi:hypothetical protein
VVLTHPRTAQVRSPTSTPRARPWTPATATVAFCPGVVVSTKTGWPSTTSNRIRPAWPGTVVTTVAGVPSVAAVTTTGYSPEAAGLASLSSSRWPSGSRKKQRTSQPWSTGGVRNSAPRPRSVS